MVAIFYSYPAATTDRLATLDDFRRLAHELIRSSIENRPAPVKISDKNTNKYISAGSLLSVTYTV